MSTSVLVLGASGRFGRNAAHAFRAAGWTVSEFDRATQDLSQAAMGQDVIVNAWNPPYPDWAGTIPGLTQRVIAAARASGASVILPGNVYVFGQDAPERFAPDTAHQATNPLGRIRIEMEQTYRDSGVQTILLRGGDFLDVAASGNWFDMVIAARLRKGTFRYPGPMTVPHAWAYLPDMAKAAVALAERRGSLQRFEDIPFPGFTLTGAELAAAVNAVVPINASRMSWWPIKIAAPFWRTGRHLLEMRYLWDKPHHLDAARLNKLLPGFEGTPLDQAIAAATAPLR